MYPFVAASTQQHDIGGIKSEVLVTRPRLYVVDVQTAPTSIPRPASLARVVVTLKYLAEKFLTLSPCVFALTFGSATAYESGAIFASPVKHPIGLSAKPRLRDAGLFAQSLACFLRVFLAKKWIRLVSASHVVVNVFQIFTTRAGRYIEIPQLLIDILGVAFDYFPDVVRRKTFNDVLLIKPITVKMWRFIHAVIVPPYLGLNNVFQ